MSTVTAVLDGGNNVIASSTYSTATTILIPAEAVSISASVFKDCANLTTVTFEGSAVTTIGYAAFQGCSYLTAITIPTSVTSIGENVFYFCGSLASVIFPAGSSCVSIGNSAFNLCNSLPSIVLPSTLVSIGDYGFYSCSALTSVTFSGNALTTIGASAFVNCSKLTAVTTPSSLTSDIGAIFNSSVAVTYTASMDNSNVVTGWNNNPLIVAVVIPASAVGIAASAFQTCTNLATVTFQGSAVTTIGASAFKDCPKLTTITLPASITSIGDNAFRDCYRLTTVTFEGSAVTTFGYAAFQGCSALTAITIPTSITSIGENTFYFCGSLASVVFPAGSSCVSIGNSAFNLCNSLPSIVLPSTLVSIGDYGFYSCSALTSVTFSGNALTTIGANAFVNCSTLTAVTTPSSLTSNIGAAFNAGVAITYTASMDNSNMVTGWNNNTNIIAVIIPASAVGIAASAFQTCANLATVTFQGSAVTTIGASAFKDCPKLTTITLPASVTSIGDNAFRDCYRLTTITFQGSDVTTIGTSAFQSCSALTAITIPTSVTSIGENAFYFCGSLASVVFPAGSSCVSIGNSAFNLCNSLTSIVLPSTLVSIGDYGFYNCIALTSVTFSGNALTTIGASAFVNCSTLTAVTTPSSLTGNIGAAFNAGVAVTYTAYLDISNIVTGWNNNTNIIAVVIPAAAVGIADSAFLNCANLATVTFQGSAVTTIGDSAFKDCPKLTAITLPAAVTSVGASAFQGCITLTSVTFQGSAVTTIGTSAFQSCSALTAITIPKSVTSIGNNVFYFCSALTSVVFPAGSFCETIGSSAFNLCNSLTSIVFPSTVTTISNYGFYRCTALTSVTFLGNDITTIGANAFIDSSLLSKVTVPNSVTSTLSGVFHANTVITRATLSSITISASTATATSITVDVQDSDSKALSRNYAVDLSGGGSVRDYGNNSYSDIIGLSKGLYSNLLPNTTYTLTVAVANTDIRTAITVKTIPSPPTITTAAVTATSITFDVAHSIPGVQSLSYDIDLSGGGNILAWRSMPFNQTIGVTNGLYSDLTPNTEYTLTVTIANTTIQSSLTVKTLPSPPTITYATVTYKSITFDVEHSDPGAQDLTYAVDLSGAGSVIDYGNNSYSDIMGQSKGLYSGLTPDTDYTLTVTIANTTIRKSLTVKTLPYPLAITCPIVTATSIKFDVEDSLPGALSNTYDVDLSGGGGSQTWNALTYSATIGANNGLFSDLPPNTAYTLTVRVINTDIQASLTVKTLPSPPTITTAAVTATSIRFTAEHSDPGTQSLLYTIDLSGGGHVQTWNALTYNDIIYPNGLCPGLTPNTAYTFTISIANTTVSASRTVYTLPAPPTITTSNITNSSFNLVVTDTYTAQNLRYTLTVLEGDQPFQYWQTMTYAELLATNGVLPDLSSNVTYTITAVSSGPGGASEPANASVVTAATLSNTSTVSDITSLLSNGSQNPLNYITYVASAGIPLQSIFEAAATITTISVNALVSAVASTGASITDVATSAVSAGLPVANIVSATLTASPSSVSSIVNSVLGTSQTPQDRSVLEEKVAAGILGYAHSSSSTAVFSGLAGSDLDGSSISIPANVASTTYATYTPAALANMDSTLPLVFNVPDSANGNAISLSSTANNKTAIDLTSTLTFPINGFPGYSFTAVGDGVSLRFNSPSGPPIILSAATLPQPLSIGTQTITIVDMDLGGTPMNGAPVCFFGDAPVKTPTGSRRIDSLKVGDRVSTPSGTAVIQHIHCQDYAAGPSSNPYVIPKGRFGATQRLLISPRHRVAVGGQMVEARNLGLKQEEATGTLTYYNLGLGGANMIVAGVTVESLVPLVRVTISRAEFNYILATKYGGKMTPEIRAACHFLADGVSVPVAP